VVEHKAASDRGGHNPDKGEVLERVGEACGAQEQEKEEIEAHYVQNQVGANWQHAKMRLDPLRHRFVLREATAPVVQKQLPREHVQRHHRLDLLHDGL